MVKRHYDQSELLNYVELDKNTKTLKDKVILLHLDSFCLGDTICFASFIDSFVEFHNPKKVIVSTFFPHLLISNNERCKIINANQNKKLTIDKLIDVGYDKNNLSHTLGGMLYATKDTMMLPQSTPLKKPHLIREQRNIIPNKITIAPESLKSIAQWNKDGWQKIVDELVKSGYDVPVVMISGFTKEHNEFDCFRVINKSVCNGCFNLFPNIDTKCPIFLNTDRENECHKKITPEMVITQINNALLFTTQQ